MSGRKHLRLALTFGRQYLSKQGTATAVPGLPSQSSHEAERVFYSFLMCLPVFTAADEPLKDVMGGRRLVAAGGTERGDGLGGERGT